MAATLPVLMYHALMQSDRACPGADPHYAVTAEQFERHLELIAGAGLQIRSVASLLSEPPAEKAPVTAMTFDDGHDSNAAAARAILRRGGAADLFVNPARVGTPHYLGWAELRELAESGISIQSHGQTHRLLNELAPEEVEFELAASKREIEDRLGRPVTLFAPPGGRLAPGLAQLARRLGYQAMCASRVGVWNPSRERWDIPRLAVLASTSDARFTRWVQQDRGELLRQRARYRSLHFAKHLLGNQSYERLRRHLLPVQPENK